MFVYALFDNCTAEEVRLTLISQGVNEPLNIIVKATGKNNNNINLKNSAIRGIQTAHNTVFSESIGKYRYNKNITVSPFFFSNQIDGDSATLAFAISYAVHLAKEGKIKCRLPEIKVAATGDLLLNGDVLKIESLKEKVIAAINEGISLLLYPSDNLQDLTNARQNDADFDRMIRESKITLKHVSTIHQAFGEIGILDKTVFSINYTVIESKKISLSIFISNPNMYRINDFVLAISGIKGITAISFRDNSISTTVFNDILYVKFDSKNQVERSINCKSVKFIIDVSTDQIQDNFIIEFVKKYCIINGVNLEDMAGFNFVSNKVEFRKNYAYKPIAPKKKSRKVLLPVIIALLLYLMTPSIVLNTLSTLINYKDSTGKTWLINKELVRSEGTIAKNVKKNYLCFSELSDVTKD